MLTREQILAANDRPTSTLEVPEWGGSVCIRVLSGIERDKLDAEFSAAKGGSIANMRARFASLVLCDEAGSPIFSAADIAKLAEKSSIVLDRILEAGMKHNRIGPAEVKQLAGESGGDQSTASGSGSPSPSV